MPPDGPDLKPSAFQKLTPMHQQSLENTGLTRQTSETSQKPTSDPTQAQLSSLEDSHASRSPSPGSKEARKMTVSSGRACSRLLPQSSPLGSLVKMLLVSSAWNSTVCCLTWKAKATPHFRLLFQLAPSMPSTGGIASGLWQTPVADDSAEREKGKFNSRGEPKLLAQVKLWPTVKASDVEKCAGAHRGKADTLTSAVKLFPTPTRSDYRGPNLNPAKQGQAEPASGHALPAIVGGQLNPLWVEWLMGYPPGWTELKASEMPSSRRSRSKSSKQ